MRSGGIQPGRPFSSLVSILLSCALLATACSMVGSPGRAGAPILTQVISSDHPLAVKIFLGEPGYYQIRSSELINAGVDAKVLDASKISLTHRGKPVNFWVGRDDQEFTFGFYGETSDSLYSRENIYWLELAPPEGDALQAQPQETEISSEEWPGITDLQLEITDTILSSLHLEQNILYLPQVDKGDHWLWMNLAAPNTADVELELSELAPGQARVRVSVWASTAAPVSPDHHLRLLINGSLLADEYLDGMGRHLIEAQISTEILRNGTNQLKIDSPGDTGVPADIVYIDWVDVVFTRYPVVTGDAIEFSAAGDVIFRGFNEPYRVYDITNPADVLRINDQYEPGARFTGIAGKHYLAVGDAGFKRPGRISLAMTLPDLRSVEYQADYFAIGPEELLEPLAPLIKLRTEQGLASRTVDLQSVYDQFNFGFPEPEAIHAFISYAAENWSPRPRFVLLVGDGSYDPKGYVSAPEANLLPTFLVQTQFGGETATDVGFVQLNEDPWPDLAIGRIPAQTSRQVRGIVAKTLAYETAISDGSLTPSVIAVADGQEAYFQDDAQAFLDLFPPRYRTELYSPAAGVQGANQEIRKYFDAGNELVAYFGHGSVNMWGKDKLFTTEDVSHLAESEFSPIVVNMTCLTGLFTHPKVESLAEALLWRQNGGAVALLAPSSLTLPGDQSYLSQALVEAILAESGARLGEVHLQARRRVPDDNSGTLDVMRTFMLFGDPALRLVR